MYPWPLPVSAKKWTLSSTTRSCHHVLPKHMGPRNLELNPPKSWAETNLSSFKLSVRYFDHSNENQYIGGCHLATPPPTHLYLWLWQVLALVLLITKNWLSTCVEVGWQLLEVNSLLLPYGPRDQNQDQNPLPELQPWFGQQGVCTHRWEYSWAVLPPKLNEAFWNQGGFWDAHATGSCAPFHYYK